MKRLTIALSILCFSCIAARADVHETYTVARTDIYSSYIVKKIWLDNHALPVVTISDVVYRDGVNVPANPVLAEPSKVEVMIGVERKRPFAIVHIPAYSSNGAGGVNEVASFTLHVAEEQPATPVHNAMKTTAVNSPLASGSWYKVSVANTGLYKLDYDFITSKLGVPAASVNLSQIRVFGKGGNMISEKNEPAVNEGLQENAIWVNDNDGNGSFSQGDYVIFYARGPISWALDTPGKKFIHTKNLYDDKGYYFINFDQGEGLRIGFQVNPPAANATVTSYNDYQLHEEDLYNPGKLGKVWWGEDFGDASQASRSFDFTLGDVSSAEINIVVGSRSAGMGNTFRLSLNGQQRDVLSIGPAGQGEEDVPVRKGTARWKLDPYTSSQASVGVSYQGTAPQAIGYLDYIEINTRRALSFANEQFTFRDFNSVAQGNIAGYQVGNANAATQVWDVTSPLSPVRMAGSLNGSTYTFTQDASTMHEFAALNGSNLPVPEYIGKVDNQNVAGSGPVDYIIVTHPDFIAQANELADFHHSRKGMRTLVVTKQQVYNEFSSGGQDIAAIRDLARMFYERAADTTEMPKYLLLLGDASYDYKDRIANNTNFVPTFESFESFSVLDAYCNDDFFGFLDEGENIENLQIPNTLDIGVGRFPVKSKDEAQGMVNKVKHYKSPASLGPWRLSTTLIADDEDIAGPHMEDAEVMESTILKNSDLYNSTKIYEDVMEMVSTPGGLRAPEANKAINDQVFKGSFLLNYNGHGNTLVLSHERILTQDDYNKWDNMDKLPFMVTATCDYGRFDHPEYVSSGERLPLKSDGGVIAALTTTQLVYQDPNRAINRAFLDAQFSHKGNDWNSFGDAIRIGKNKIFLRPDSFGSHYIINIRKFALLGDPALEPNFPEYFIHTESITDGANNELVDSIGALGQYVINGKVTDVNGNTLENFNGRLTVVFYDKPRRVDVTTYFGAKSFTVRNNIIYKGKATVTNGRFSVAFIAPKDINYDFGKGRISYYAENGTTDAAGTDTSYVVGGFSDNPNIEDDAPLVRAYIGDSLFRSGGLTGNNSLLFGILEDETGINVSGNSVGHDLVAILDGDVANAWTLNDYYETAPNTYKRGYVSFPLVNLPDGRHRITIKAWDVNNNSGEGYVDFEVGNGKIMQVQNLMNYPNPFRDKTHFRFEHNHPDEVLKAEINIYTSTGMLVRSLRQNFEPTGSHSDEIVWDGTQDNGSMLPSGVYIYRMNIITDKGAQTTAYQKLVIVR